MRGRLKPLREWIHGGSGTFSGAGGLIFGVRVQIGLRTCRLTRKKGLNRRSATSTLVTRAIELRDNINFGLSIEDDKNMYPPFKKCDIFTLSVKRKTRCKYTISHI